MSTKLTEDFDILTAIDLKKLRTELKNKSAHAALQLLKTQYLIHYHLIYSQVQSQDKLKQKLPTFEKHGCWITQRALEQASSEVAAKYKSSLVSGKTLLDLSAGIGADDVAFANSFEQVTALDIDAELHALASMNLRLLGIQHVIRICTSAETFLANNKSPFDWVYLDADRRPDGTRKYGLEDTTPNVLEHLPAIWKISSSLMLKVSPMMDMSYLLNTLNGVAHIYVVSIQNEVKELLVLMHRDGMHAAKIHAVDLDKQGNVLFIDNCLHTEKHSLTIAKKLDYTGMYVYEPRVAFAKSGVWRKQYEAYQIELMSNKHHLGVSQHHHPIAARVFQVVAQLPINPKRIKQYLKANQIEQAHISSKHFQQTPDELRKQYKLKDGGDDYLFFTTSADQNGMFLHTKKIQ